MDEEQQGATLVKIHRVKHSRTALTCGRCGAVIHPSRDVLSKNGKTKRVLGDPYVWIKHRYGGKQIRCASTSCVFRDSDLTTSSKLATVYDLRDNLIEDISKWEGDDADALRSLLSEASEAIREVAGEYEESADNIEQHFPSGSPTSEACREQAENLNGWADELEGAEIEDWEPEVEEGDEEDEEEVRDSQGRTKEEWAEAQRETADDVASGCPV